MKTYNYISWDDKKATKSEIYSIIKLENQEIR